jgi:endonuclease YncB( thermonuclease family)
MRLLPLLASLLLLPGGAAAAGPAATVLSVGDGDTITVRQGSERIRVRLACIDAPETSQRPWGQQARQQLQQLAPVGSTVQLQVKATDRYGRTVAEVFSGGRNINQALVASGAAFVYWQYAQRCDRNAYASLEQRAKAQRVGVWSANLQPPWDYRRCRRSKSC